MLTYMSLILVTTAFKNFQTMDNLFTIGEHVEAARVNSWPPEAIAIDTNGDVYVADTMNDRIQMFDNQFKFQFVKIGR